MMLSTPLYREAGFRPVKKPEQKPLSFSAVHFAGSIPVEKQVSGFIHQTPLAEALKWTPEQTLKHLASLMTPQDLEKLHRHEQIKSPLVRQGIQDSKWLQQTKIVGINPRAVGTYFNILKTAMIYPERGIHLLPAYTTNNCLYNPQDWTLSREFLDPYLSKQGLHTPEQQLRYVVSALHALGKAVGMDVLPHTDAFSKESFIHPDKFEWIKLNASKTGQLFSKELQFDALSAWEKDKVTSYYLQSKTSTDTYNHFLQTLKEKDSQHTKHLHSFPDGYKQCVDAIQHVYKLNRNQIEKQGWSLYKSLLQQKSYVALNAEEKEVLQRVFETQKKPSLETSDVADYFHEHLVKLQHPNETAHEVKRKVIDYLKQNGDSQGKAVPQAEQFFTLPAEQREQILFGPSKTPEQLKTATQRHHHLILELQNRHIEPLPVADNQVLRPIRFDRMRQAEDWYPIYDKPNLDPTCNYEFFGNLMPYAFFSSKKNGYLNTHHPRQSVFDYYAQKVAQLQKELGLDFVRADMAHVQTAHATDQLSAKGAIPHEFLAHTKQTVQKQAPHFALYGESFLWGEKSIDQVQDLNNKKIDVSSGDIDRQKVNAQFIESIRDKTTATERDFKEALSVITHDSDQVHHNALNQNPLATKSRYFMHLFQAHPGYVMAGYETRPESKNHAYLFKQNKPFQWGSDQKQFQAIEAMRTHYQRMQPNFKSPWQQEWLSSDQKKGVGAWVWKSSEKKSPQWLMVANTDLKANKKQITLSNPFALNPDMKLQAKQELTTAEQAPLQQKLLVSDQGRFTIPTLAKGEHQTYRLSPLQKAN